LIKKTNVLTTEERKLQNNLKAVKVHWKLAAERPES
jgi:hypothetical protein